MDEIYKQHSGLLEKVYLRHIEDSEQVAKHSIEAGTSTFKAMAMAPLQFLLQYFNISTGIALSRVELENESRDDVDDAEDDVNDPDDVDQNGDEDKNDDEPDTEPEPENNSVLLTA